MNKYAPNKRERARMEREFRRRMRRLAGPLVVTHRGADGSVVRAERKDVPRDWPRGLKVVEDERGPRPVGAAGLDYCPRCFAPLRGDVRRVKAVYYCSPYCAGIVRWLESESSTHDPERGGVFVRALDAFKARHRPPPTR